MVITHPHIYIYMYIYIYTYRVRKPVNQLSQIQWNDETPCRFLLIYLAKATHRPWTSPWFDGPQKWGSFVLWISEVLDEIRDEFKNLGVVHFVVTLSFAIDATEIVY